MELVGVTSFSIDLETKMVTVRGHVSAVGVMESISKVKKAELLLCSWNGRKLTFNRVPSKFPFIFYFQIFVININGGLQIWLCRVSQSLIMWAVVMLIYHGFITINSRTTFFSGSYFYQEHVSINILFFVKLEIVYLRTELKALKSVRWNS